jgi:2'-5' RNA ligase
MAGLRLFVAVDPAEDARARIRDATARVRELAPTAKWVDAAAIHLTLAFLGDRDEAMVPAIALALDGAARGHAPIDLTVRGAGAFGGRRPRVLWVGMGGPVEALAALQRDVCAALAPVGFAQEDRPWSPHLTVARARDPRGDTAFDRCAAALAAEELGATRVGEIVLYRSELSRTGPTYTKLHASPLAAPAGVGA